LVDLVLEPEPKRKEQVMMIFVAGASGAVGRQLVPLLVESGHEVVGSTTSPGKADAVRALGAEPVVLDLLDAEAVGRAVSEAAPEVVVHEATALAAVGGNLRKFDEAFAQTNRLRTEGTDNLLAAAKAVDVRKFVAQSYAGWPYARDGAAVKSEDDRLDPSPVSNARETIGAIRHLEESVLAATWLEGIVLRYGGFYGPGTSLAADGEMIEPIRKRFFPVVGSGAGMASFIHIEDAAGATLAAIERGKPGVYNVVDDEPAPVSEWLPYLADVVGAKPPRHVPLWLGKLMAGEQLATMMTEGRGASNAKAKRELGWTLLYPSWREGFVAAVADEPLGKQLRSAA
jgi:nucleoside-diphosphate-sugar epimerase